MTELPQLKVALLEAGRARGARRGPGRWAVAAVATAALLAVVALVATTSPDVERPAQPPAVSAPPSSLEAAFGVFRRSRVADDRIPDPRFVRMVTDTVVEIDRSRLVARDAGFRLYLVPGSRRGAPALCAFSFDDRGRGATSSCAPLRIAVGESPLAASGGSPATGWRTYAVLRDGIASVRLRFAEGGAITRTVAGNAVTEETQKPVCRMVWRDPEGGARRLGFSFTDRSGPATGCRR